MKIKVFYLILSVLYLLLMIWLFAIGDYKAIIRSICILIESFIFGIIYGILEGE